MSSEHLRVNVVVLFMHLNLTGHGVDFDERILHTFADWGLQNKGITGFTHEYLSLANTYS